MLIGTTPPACNKMREIVGEAIKRGLTARAEPYDYTDTPAMTKAAKEYAAANPGKPSQSSERDVAAARYNSYCKPIERHRRSAAN